MSEGRPEDINGDSPRAIALDANVESDLPDPSPEDMGSLASSVQEVAPLDVDATTHEQAPQEDFPTPAIVPMQASEEPVANSIERDSVEDSNVAEIGEPAPLNDNIRNEGEATLQPVDETTTGSIEVSNVTPGQDASTGDAEHGEEALSQQSDAELNVASSTTSDSDSDSDRHVAASSSSTAMPSHGLDEDRASAMSLENESSNPQIRERDDVMGLGVQENSDITNETMQVEQPIPRESTSDTSSDVIIKGEIESIKDEVESKSMEESQDQQQDTSFASPTEAEQSLAPHEGIKEERAQDTNDAMEDIRIPSHVSISEPATEVQDASLPAHDSTTVPTPMDAMTDGMTATGTNTIPLSVKQEVHVEIGATPGLGESTQVAQIERSAAEETVRQLDESIETSTAVQSTSLNGGDVVNVNISIAVEQPKVDGLHSEDQASNTRTEAMNSDMLAQPSLTVSHTPSEERRDSTASSAHESIATEAQTSTLTVTTTVAVEATVETRATPVIPTTVPPAALAAAEAAGGAGCTRCPCNDNENEDGFMIQCELCDVWQHGLCIGINSENEAPSQYFCELCLPDLEVHRRRREHAANGVFYTRPAKTRRARGERSKKSTATSAGGGRGKSAKAASPAGEDEEEPTEEATARRSPADGGDSMHASSEHHAEVDETASGVHAVTAPAGTNVATSTSSLDRDLMTIDDSKLTREERSLKRYMESFLKLEERQRRAIQVQQQKSSINTASGSSFGSGTSFSGKDLAGSNSASASSFGADSGPIEGEDPRAARLRQRERQRLLEEHQARIAQAQLLEDQPPRPPTPPPLGSPTSPHPPEWIMRSLKPRGDMYLGRKSYLLRATLAAPGPFDPVVVEPQFLSQGNWTKRLALMHEAESDAQGLPRPIPMRGSLTSPRATQDVGNQSR